MACCSSATHAFIQYVQDKEKEIVPLTQISTSKVASITCGKIVPVKWYNDETSTWDFYEAYIHFLGSSETDVEFQVQEAEKNGTRLKLPSQKLVDAMLSQEDSCFAPDDEAELKKARMTTAKSRLNEEILQQKKHNLLLEARETLQIENLEDIESGKEHLEETQRRELLHLNDASEKENYSEVEDEEGHREPTTSKVLSTFVKRNKTRALLKSMGHKTNNTEKAAPQSSERQNLQGKNNLERSSSADRVKMQRYDTHNDQTYLGAGIFVETCDWISIKAIQDHGPFIIQLALAIWGDDLVNMCLDEKKAKARYEGQIRKKFRKKQLKALEEIFLEKLRSQGYKGNRKLQKMVKKVRTTLTHKINDLNKRKSRPIEDESSDSED